MISGTCVPSARGIYESLMETVSGVVPQNPAAGADDDHCPFRDSRGICVAETVGNGDTRKSRAVFKRAAPDPGEGIGKRDLSKLPASAESTVADLSGLKITDIIRDV